MLADGTLVGRMDHAFKDMVNIREAQIYQRILGEIEVRICKTEHYSEKDEITVMAELRKRLGNRMIIRYNYVDAIKRTKNGKLRFVVSELNRD